MLWESWSDSWDRSGMNDALKEHKRYSLGVHFFDKKTGFCTLLVQHELPIRSKRITLKRWRNPAVSFHASDLEMKINVGDVGLSRTGLNEPPSSAGLHTHTQLRNFHPQPQSPTSTQRLFLLDLVSVLGK